MSRRRLLVPEARDALTKMRDDISGSVRLPGPDASVGGHWPTAGPTGNGAGPVEGEMVRRLVELALRGRHMIDGPTDRSAVRRKHPAQAKRQGGAGDH
ncbi:MAG: small, acid-soluble spore protein, alpha/beta type [Firmicutes bacterium]|nr:small, acid-soluble spore protein, alpha/beta type [Bacillota bacterium]